MPLLGTLLLVSGLLLGPAYLLRQRMRDGRRRSECAVHADGVGLSLAPEENGYVLLAWLTYRLPRGPLNCRYTATLRGPDGFCWRQSFALRDVDVSRGAFTRRPVSIGRFQVPQRARYRLMLEPDVESDSRVRIDAIELRSHLPPVRMVPVVSGHLLLLAGAASILWG